MAMTEIMKFKRLHYNIGDLIYGPKGPERIAAFNEIISFYKEKLKAINGKIIYAYLTPDDTERNSTKFDFCIVMKIRNEQGHEIILIETPIRYSDKCIASFVACKKANKLEDYYYETMKLSCRLTAKSFNEYIENMCDLSTDASSANYWKLTKGVNIILEKFADISMRYIPSLYQNQ